MFRFCCIFSTRSTVRPQVFACMLHMPLPFQIIKPFWNPIAFFRYPKLWQKCGRRFWRGFVMCHNCGIYCNLPIQWDLIGTILFDTGYQSTLHPLNYSRISSKIVASATHCGIFFIMFATPHWACCTYWTALDLFSKLWHIGLNLVNLQILQNLACTITFPSHPTQPLLYHYVCYLLLTVLHLLKNYFRFDFRIMACATIVTHILTFKPNRTSYLLLRLLPSTEYFAPTKLLWILFQNCCMWHIFYPSHPTPQNLSCTITFANPICPTIAVALALSI